MFTDMYKSALSYNYLIADEGIIVARYDFDFATPLVDILVFDLDESDVVRVEVFGMNGEALSPETLSLIGEGDLSLNRNASDRPASEAATPPTWNPTTGVLSASVSWNENRSYSILRPSEPIKSVVITFTGVVPATEENVAGSVILFALWATPRESRITQTALLPNNAVQLRWLSLPGVEYQIMGTEDFSEWNLINTVIGESAPAVKSSWTSSVPATSGKMFFQIRQP